MAAMKDRVIAAAELLGMDPDDLIARLDDEPGAWGPSPADEEAWDAREEWIRS